MSSSARAARRGASKSAEAGEESWFGAFGPPEADLGDAAQESRFDRRPSDSQSGADSRFLSRQARRLAESGQGGLQRLYRAFVGARALLGMVLLFGQVLIAVLGPRPRLDTLLLCLLYASCAVALWLLPALIGGMPELGATRLRRRQWAATVGFDLVVFSALHLSEQGNTLNYSALLMLPVLMGGALTPRPQALAAAAIATLTLLLSAWLSVVGGGEPLVLITQAGLAGGGLFFVAILAGELSGRLAREERTSRGSLELARQQAQLNRLVIEEMHDGVLVVDRRGRVRTANPAARALIGAPRASSGVTAFPLAGVAAWQPLVEAVERAFGEGGWPEAGRDIALTGGTHPRQLRVRMRFTRRRDTRGGGRPAEELCVLFIEDVRAVEARMRQEKLAAMGRVSAGIAHEIRNPLSAIAQANALMAEDASTPEQRQLTQMVSDNVERLKRIVDDVMEIAPGRGPDAGVIDGAAHIAAICSEWARTARLTLDDSSPMRVELPHEGLGVMFDGDHLRRVLVNLLDNALRHGTRTPGCIRVRFIALDGERASLSVASDGASIPPDVERYLFEPFFSTRSRGTGLGLYICRELCERYDASIEYTPCPAGERHVNEFFVRMRRKPLSTSEARLHLAP